MIYPGTRSSSETMRSTLERILGERNVPRQRGNKLVSTGVGASGARSGDQSGEADCECRHAVLWSNQLFCLINHPVIVVLLMPIYTQNLSSCSRSKLGLHALLCRDVLSADAMSVCHLSADRTTGDSVRQSGDKVARSASRGNRPIPDCKQLTRS